MKPRARIFDVRIRRRDDKQQMALFADPTPRKEVDSTTSNFVGPLRPNPYRRHVLLMREMRAEEAARHTQVPA